jgi:hypothetical protein
MIRVRISSVTTSVDNLSLDTAVRRIARVEVMDATRMIFNQASINAPVDTGNLRAQHRMAIKDLKGSVKGTVSNNTKYAAAVHDGSRPHIIRPKRRKALAFDPGGWEGIVVRKWVRHPGTKGQPWLRTAAIQVALRKGMKFEWTMS